jgi:KUP system potassium uptake protein
MLAIDLSFFGANILKVAQGGWFPLVVAAAVFTFMSTWKKGRTILAERLRDVALPFDMFLSHISETPPVRVPGTAVFMTGSAAGTPTTMLHNLQHNHVLHRQIVLLTVVTADVPHVAQEERVQITPLADGFYRLIARYGFVEEPNVPEALELARAQGLETSLADTTFFLGKETLIATRRPGMALWREKLFILMSRNAQRATAFFRIPTERVVELGLQVEL